MTVQARAEGVGPMFQKRKIVVAVAEPDAIVMGVLQFVQVEVLLVAFSGVRRSLLAIATCRINAMGLPPSVSLRCVDWLPRDRLGLEHAPGSMLTSVAEARRL